uniref:Uncharacterized protein n=1 Tax=Opuntia streptacantha TaxID=393608 RepID=A0A7C9D0U9_OPUST
MPNNSFPSSSSESDSILTTLKPLKLDELPGLPLTRSLLATKNSSPQSDKTNPNPPQLPSSSSSSSSNSTPRSNPNPKSASKQLASISRFPSITLNDESSTGSVTNSSLPIK